MRLLVGFTCIVFSVGCSDDDKVRHLPDAPPPPDADVDASTFGPVSLTILQGVDPRVGIRVVFQNADSSVVADTTTGTDGKASAMMMPGGSVTAIDPFPGQSPGGIATVTDIRTIAGVKPGDQLRMFEQPINTPAAITVNVILPIDNAASDYYVSTNCLFDQPIPSAGSGSQPMGTLVLSGCGPTSNLLVRTFDSTLAPNASLYRQNVALVDNGTVDLTAATYTAIPDVTFSYTNVPAELTAVFLNGVRATSLGRIYEFNTNEPVDTGSANFSLKVPDITGATAVTASTFYSGGGFTQHMLTEWGPASSSYSLDTAGMFLPSFDGPAQLDVAAHSAKWTVMGGSGQPDFVMVRAFLGREAPAQSWRWTVVAPGGTQAVMPVLPASSTFNPVAGDFASFDVRTGKVPGGYDAVRANLLATAGLQELAVGATGKASFTFLVEPGAIKPPVGTHVLRGLSPRRR